MYLYLYFISTLLNILYNLCRHRLIKQDQTLNKQSSSSSHSSSSSSLFCISLSSLLHVCQSVSSSTLDKHQSNISPLHLCQKHLSSRSLLCLPLSCDWMKPRKQSTRCCGCSCNRSWSCSTPTRARSRSTRTRSTRGRSRTWSRGCPSAAPCWSRGSDTETLLNVLCKSLVSLGLDSGRRRRQETGGRKVTEDS